MIIVGQKITSQNNFIYGERRK